MTEFIPLFMFLVAGLILMTGYPVAFALAGTALIFSLLGIYTGGFDSAFLEAMPSRLFGIMTN